MFAQTNRQRGIFRVSKLLGTASLLALSGGWHAALSMAIDTNVPDLTIRWDNTFTENTLFRTSAPSGASLRSPNNDDPDRNFRRSPAALRSDLTTELDVKYRDFGVRATGAAWWDAVYSYDNTNNSAATLNSFVGNNQQWSRQTQQLAGYRAEIGDLFTYGATSFGEQRFSYRLGQFTQLWGESLFLATNGIAYGMNPIDGIKGQLLLNPQARDVFMPTPQISFTYQPTPPVSISAYWKLGFRATRAAPVGSYFSSTDVLDAGGNLLYVNAPGLGLVNLTRGNNIEPKGTDQFGLSLKYNFGGATVGLYALQYDEPTPEQIYPHPFSAAQIFGNLERFLATKNIGTYQVVYPRGIQIYGASVTTDVFEVINMGAELSLRHGTDLSSQIASAPPNASNSKNPAYPIGNTAHGQVSFIYASPPVPSIGADQIQVLGEIGFNELLSVTKNRAALAPGVNNFAALADVVVQAQYYSVRPGLDITPSVGIAWQVANTSSVDTSERAHTATLSLGLAAKLNQKYNFLAQYRHYIGDNSTTNPNLNNLLLGRDFIGFEFSTVF